MANEYRRIETAPRLRPLREIDPEAALWSQYRPTHHAQQTGAVTCLDYSPVRPFDLAATSSSRVAVLSGLAPDTARYVLTRFKAPAASARFRSDGALLCAAGDEGIVRVFDNATKAELRVFAPPRAPKTALPPVRTCDFSLDKVSVGSGDDSGVVRLWDLPTGENTVTIPAAHKDSIRRVLPSPSSSGVWCSAGYDGYLRLWDTRNGKNSKICEMKHDAPIESCIFLPGGAVCITAGSNYLCVWDILSGGKMLAMMRNHQKTITALALEPAGHRLLSGGTDKLIKAYDVVNYRVVASRMHHAAVLSLAFNSDASHLAVGAADGDICIHTRSMLDDDEDMERAASAGLYKIAPETKEQPVTRDESGTLRYFLRGESVTNLEEEKKTKRELAMHDKLLRKFHYKDALNAALETEKHEVVVGMLQELIHRGGLLIALRDRDEARLEPLLVFLLNYCTKPEYCKLLTKVTMAVVDMYAPTLGSSPRIDELFFKLQTRLHREVELQNELVKLMGSLDMLVASAELTDPDFK